MKREDIKHQVKDKEVVMSIEEFEKLIRYIDDLKEANEYLNAQIKDYNKKFVKGDGDGV